MNLRPLHDLRGRDPTMFLLAVAAWAASSCLSLLASPHSYNTRPMFALLRALHIPAAAMGSVMLGDALALLWSLFWAPVWCRPAVTVLTAMLWLFWGLMLTGGGLLAHMLSSAGVFSLVCGVFAVMGTVQWSGMHR